MKCCGFDLKTAYCPNCGKESRARTALEQIAGFFKLRLKAAKKKKVQQARWFKDKGSGRTESEQRRVLKTQDGAIDQWGRWASAVEKAIRAESRKKARR